MTKGSNRESGKSWSQPLNPGQFGFDAFVFSDPLLDLREQLGGNIDRAGFAIFFESQVMGQMAPVVLAVAAFAAALAIEGHQGRGDHWPLGPTLLDPGQKVTADQGGCLGIVSSVFDTATTETYMDQTSFPAPDRL
ncbi:MAG: hypothetical protein WC076_11025 [Terrimicrobiaceae bacterium]|nr:hypothetical protein [Terrimicrobiaceae bacterium]